MKPKLTLLLDAHSVLHAAFIHDYVSEIAIIVRLDLPEVGYNNIFERQELDVFKKGKQCASHSLVKQ